MIKTQRLSKTKTKRTTNSKIFTNIFLMAALAIQLVKKSCRTNKSLVSKMVSKPNCEKQIYIINNHT